MALAAMLWAVSARCEPCFKFYVGRWARRGQDRTLRIPRCRLHNGRVRRRDVRLEGLQGVQRPLRTANRHRRGRSQAAVPNNALRHHGFCTSSAARRERRIRHVKSNCVLVLPRFSRLPRAARRGGPFRLALQQFAVPGVCAAVYALACAACRLRHQRLQRRTCAHRSAADFHRGISAFGQILVVNPANLAGGI